jgi:uncharacterized membrane protein SpoIIM required for sporulation
MISTVTEAAFAERRQADWNRLDELSRTVSAGGIGALGSKELVALAPLYSDACADLARARAARYSAPLIDYLQGLTAAAHTVVYGIHAREADADGEGSVRHALGAFPRAVRARWRPILLAGVLFFVPMVLAAVATIRTPEFAMRLIPGEMLDGLAEAYGKGFSEGRALGTSTAMAGFYVNNNIGIALRCFALGIFGGVGSVFFLVDNGLTTGAMFGYVTSQGAGDNILTFIVGHGSLELGAIVLAGGAGMALGWSMVAPGERTRLASLQAAAREVVVIVFGAAVMLAMAAGIEAYWSASSLPAVTKRALGACLFALVVLYLTLFGRVGHQPRPEARRWT